MNKIALFLDKYSNLKIPHETVRKTIAEILSKETKKEIKMEDVKVAAGCVFVSCPPVIKQEIALKKKKILEQAKKALGQRTPKNIR